MRRSNLEMPSSRVGLHSLCFIARATTRIPIGSIGCISVTLAGSAILPALTAAGEEDEDHAEE
jgi:hypothetical protein